METPEMNVDLYNKLVAQLNNNKDELMARMDSFSEDMDSFSDEISKIKNELTDFKSVQRDLSANFSEVVDISSKRCQANSLGIMRPSPAGSNFGQSPVFWK
ncbi:MAG: hypothetical protein BA863_06065 [Desulfovibrio sp. S3730MH75]|nr:MAG: hypothetical protein BA863_06065 [Desulfovibrio sp. S3730MH75]